MSNEHTDLEWCVPFMVIRRNSLNKMVDKQSDLGFNISLKNSGGSKKSCFSTIRQVVTSLLGAGVLGEALVPSETASLASSPGSRSLTAVWISREVMVDLLL